MIDAKLITNAIRALGHTPVTVPAHIPNGICMIRARRADRQCFPDHRLQALAAQFGLNWELTDIDADNSYWILEV